MTRACIIVASHISLSLRLPLLFECLRSLLGQTVKIPIVLSISFDNDTVRKVYNRHKEGELLGSADITIIERETKMSQFTHIFAVFEVIKTLYDYIMFCDDDDTYELGRVEYFMNATFFGEKKARKLNLKYAGCRELDTSQYWSNSVTSVVMQQFVTKISEGGFDHFLENDYFDVVFLYYLYSLDNSHYFTRVEKKLYNYRENEEHSVTAKAMKEKMIWAGRTFTQLVGDNIKLIKRFIFLVNTEGIDYTVDCALQKLHITYIPSTATDLELLDELNRYYREIRRMALHLGIRR